MKLNAFLAAVRRYWVTFVVATVTVFAAGLVWILFTPAKYVSTTQLMVSLSGSTTAAAYQNDEVVTGRVNSYVALLTSDVVSQRVVDALGLPMTAQQLAANVSATRVPPNTSIIDLAVTAGSAAGAQRLADTYAREFISYAAALETPTGEDGQKIHVTTVTAASTPHGDIAERGVLGVLAALAAVLVGAVAVWIRAAIDPLVRTAERATAATGIPVLGSVSGQPAFSGDDIERFRRLRTLLNAQSGGDGRVLELVPVQPDCDVRTTALNLSRVLHLTGRRCVVVDVPSVDADAAPQPTDTPSGDAEHYEPVGEGVPGEQGGSTEPPDIRVMADWAKDPDLIANRAAPELMNRLRADFDEVLIAAPPAMSGMAASALTDHADCVLLLVCAETTKLAGLRSAVDQLTAAGARVSGLVLVDTGNHGGSPVRPGSVHQPAAVRQSGPGRTENPICLEPETSYKWSSEGNV